MSKFLTELANGIIPYTPGEQPKDKKYIKLNTNENPYPPSPAVKEAVLAEMGNLRLYPDPECKVLNQEIADYFGVKLENVFSGNGSDEVLGLAFPAFFQGRKILFPDITYSFYPVYSELFAVEFETLPLAEDFSINPEDYFRENGGVLIPNPNAPTGKPLSLSEIEKILKANKNSVVIIDEAYVDFGCESAVSLIGKYENLLVVQTFSKSRSLAGLRCGFAIGNSVLIDGLNRIKNSFNSYPLDRLAIAGATAALKDEEYFQTTRNLIMKTRNQLVINLRELGFNIPESKANFIFISHPRVDAKVLFDSLRKRGILVRYFNKPRINNHIRVTIGTDEDMKVFLREIEGILNGVENV